MKATPRNLAILTAFFVVALVISNVIAGKVLQFGIIEIPAAVLAYPVTFLMIDVISEIWGKEEAKKMKIDAASALMNQSSSTVAFGTKD